jgi:hypothetical protein
MRYLTLMVCLCGLHAGCAVEEEAQKTYPERTLTESDRRYLRQRGIRNYEGEQARRALWEREYARQEVEKARERHRERFGEP